MSKSSPSQPPLSILRRRALEARVGLKRSAIYARVKEGSFPAPINLGGNAVGWLASEVDDWIAARAGERGAA